MIEDLVMKPDALSDAEVIWPEAWAMASAAARRSGMPIEQWLNYAIIDTAADEGVRLSRSMSQSGPSAPRLQESWEPPGGPELTRAPDEVPIQPEHSDPGAQDHPMQKLVEAIVQLNGHLEKLVDGEPSQSQAPDRRLRRAQSVVASDARLEKPAARGPIGVGWDGGIEAP